MKTCRTCNQAKHSSQFSLKRDTKDGLSNICKPCDILKGRRYHRTKNGLCTAIYGTQVRNSKLRGYSKPDYTRIELFDWLNAQQVFHTLFDQWALADYPKLLAPSCDRLDDYKPYTFNNLQVVTWKENNANSHKARMTGMNRKQCKAVAQLNKQGEVLATYFSIRSAARITNISQQTITQVCTGRAKTAGGFKWIHIKEHL